MTSRAMLAVLKPAEWLNCWCGSQKAPLSGNTSGKGILEPNGKRHTERLPHKSVANNNHPLMMALWSQSMRHFLSSPIILGILQNTQKLDGCMHGRHYNPACYAAYPASEQAASCNFCLLYPAKHPACRI